MSKQYLITNLRLQQFFHINHTFPELLRGNQRGNRRFKGQEDREKRDKDREGEREKGEGARERRWVKFGREWCVYRAARCV